MRTDAEAWAAIDAETERQERQLELIASENHASAEVIAAMGTAPKASPMISVRLLDDKAKPSVVNHAPQTKNWRNIIMDSLIRMDEFMS